MSESKSYLIIRTIAKSARESAAPVTDGFTGKDKYVQFHEGFGVLDLAAIYAEQPDWVKVVDGKYASVAGETIDDYVGHFRRRGFDVIEITGEQAREFRLQCDALAIARRDLEVTKSTQVEPERFRALWAAWDNAQRKFRKEMDTLYAHRRAVSL